jgi:hypothetical protein
LGATVNVAGPGPLPDAVAIVIQGTPLDPFHAHPGVVETDAAAGPPIPEICCADGETE